MSQVRVTVSADMEVTLPRMRTGDLWPEEGEREERWRGRMRGVDCEVAILLAWLVVVVVVVDD